MKPSLSAILRGGGLFLCLLGLHLSGNAQEKSAAELFQDNDRVILIGGTFASRAQYFGHFEAALQRAFPEKKLTVRNLGWSGDEVSLMPRPLNFLTLEENLDQWEADVVFLCFGSNEAFAGEAGLKKFEADYRNLLERISPITDRLVFVSPIAHEKLPPFPDPAKRNQDLEKYTAVIRKLASERKAPFVDLFHSSRTIMAQNYQKSLTINGLHLTEEGYRVVSSIVAAEMGWPQPGQTDESVSEELRQLIIEKNRQFFLRWRPVNAEYVFGRRNKPFGIVSYPPEMKQLEEQVAELDEQIHEMVQSK
ncbi:MAG: SGNH/GDSL hydrolase family protein [Verrucomicrobiales bacterium]|nr:SGNH/GDSL hydrolase family protein [Verrucomicrobiales bacterium]